ncbi:MAG: hypothetical protein HQ581_22110 [Planctomycetes bacterium]|nr:hypothetical protein [Planctomycetota bacterium]
MRVFSSAVVLGLAMVLLPGCGPDSPSTVETPEGKSDPVAETPVEPKPEEESPEPSPPTGRPTVGKLSGLQWIPPDAPLVAVTFPGRTLDAPEWADVPIEQAIALLHRAMGPGRSASPIPWLRPLGVELADLEQVIYVVDRVRVPRPMRDTADPDAPVVLEEDQWVYGPFVDAYVLRFAEPFSQEAVLGLMYRVDAVTYAGKTYFGQGQDTGSLAVYFADERTLLAGAETAVRSMLVQDRRSTPLTEALAEVEGNDDLTAVLQTDPIPEALKREAPDNPAIQAMLRKLSVATFHLRMVPKLSARLTVTATDAQAATDLEQFARMGIESTKAEMEAIREKPTREENTEGLDPEVQEMRKQALEMADRMFEALHVEREDRRLEVAIDEFAAAADIVKLVTSAIKSPSMRRQAGSPAPPETNADARAIRRRIPAAAGMSNADFRRLAMGTTMPGADSLADQSLTLASMTVPMQRPDTAAANVLREEEFSYIDDELVQPHQLVGVLSGSVWLGYCSVIQHDRITEFTCTVDDDRAQGTVAFEEPGLYRGKIAYTAERTEEGWWITGFEMPARKWRFHRVGRGPWQWFDAHGRVTADRELPTYPVEGRVTVNGNPITGGTVRFVGTDEVTLEITSDGSFSGSLPEGEYDVSFDADSPVPEKYRLLDEPVLKFEVAPVQQGTNLMHIVLVDP